MAIHVLIESSPHPWGCFYPNPPAGRPHMVFPTPVGVFLALGRVRGPGQRLPHTRGGVSGHCSAWRLRVSSSPHPWGCFHLQNHCHHHRHVFPTPVGVFLQGWHKNGRRFGLPHTRGGVSEDGLRPVRPAESSPHPWGCFVQTPPDVFKATGLPHTRGGVSIQPWGDTLAWQSSPHPWGCFFEEFCPLFAEHVFPTPVGVFPAGACRGRGGACLPHTRGGVSISISAPWPPMRSSPHPWGCFRGSPG